jgi:hypothetical protein
VCLCACVPVGGWVRVQSWERTRLLGVWYVSDAGTATWISLFGTFLILFNTLIPISLYVTLEAVKLVQAMLMGAHGPSSATRRERERERERDTHTHTHMMGYARPHLLHTKYAPTFMEEKAAGTFAYACLGRWAPQTS